MDMIGCMEWHVEAPNGNGPRWAGPLTAIYLEMWITTWLVVLTYPCEKYESQMAVLFPTEWKKKQTTNQKYVVDVFAIET